MSDKSYMLHVKASMSSSYTTPDAMKQIDNHLRSHYPASFIAPPPDGLPVQEADGTWRIWVRSPHLLTLLMVQGILIDHYGLEIVDKVEIE